MSLFSFLSNPVTLATAAAIALGVIIYEIVTHQKEERVPTRGSGRGPSNPGSGSRRAEPSYCTSYEDLDSNVRRRKREGTETKSSSVNKVSKQAGKISDSTKDTTPKSGGTHTESSSANKVAKNVGKTSDSSKYTTPKSGSTETKSSSANKEAKIVGKTSDNSKDSTANPEFDEKNYYQNVFHRIESDIQNINQTDDKEKTFHKNIDDGVVDSSASCAPQNLDEHKLINTSNFSSKVNGKNQHASSRSSEVGNTVSIQEIQPTNDDSCPSGATALNDSQNDTGSDNGKCRACEEALANAVAYPCKHCYLCMNCAVMVHRIFKKCTLCERVVDHFETLKK